MKLTAKEKQRLRDRYGEWAVVTGASSGIGLELAARLAEAGLNLVINARNADSLHEVALHLEALSPVEIRIVAADVSAPEGVEQIVHATRDIDAGLLVVSAGYGTSGEFTGNAIDAEMDMLKVNCGALLRLTHHFSREFSVKKRGGIILMSSMVAFQGTPFAANYAATKAYVQVLAEGIAAELKPHGVDVLAAAPGPVESGFGSRAGMKMSFSLTPAQIGVPILRALGRKRTVFPGLLTKVLVYSLRTIPRWAKVRIMAKVMGGMTRHQRS